jgi:hypothetical protein
MRQSVSKGGNMGNCFAVLENGQLDMYKKEEVITYSLGFDTHFILNVCVG